MPTSLRFDGVGKRFGEHGALHGVDLTVRPGSLTMIIGPSGCGKTTLLEIAAGLQRPSEGAACLDDAPVTGPTLDSVMLFQHHNLFDWLTVQENVAFGLRNLGVGRREARGRALAQLGTVGLAAVAHRVPAELSGGMRQRVALARALVLEPKVLLLDEPFASLDHQTRRVMQRYLLSTWRRSQATILMVTHDLEEALVLADRVALMSGSPGRIVDVVDLTLERPRAVEDGRLRGLRQRLERHLESEVALGEFTEAELSALGDEALEPAGAGVR